MDSSGTSWQKGNERWTGALLTYASSVETFSVMDEDCLAKHGRMSQLFAKAPEITLTLVPTPPNDRV
jgi:hypothetical protein